MELTIDKIHGFYSNPISVISGLTYFWYMVLYYA